MVAPSPERSSDRNLLFAVLALQRGFLDQDKFVDACAGWAARRDTPIPDLLLERSWITPADQRQLQQDVNRLLNKNNGDVRASIHEVAGADPGVQRSLADLLLDPAWENLRASDLRDSDDSRSPPGQRYQKLGEPRQGGIGQVWRAKDTHLGRVVALKELRPDRVLSPVLRDRFLAEAQINAQLMHPNIIPAFELVDRGGLDGPFYTMQFVDGKTLSDAIRDFHTRRKQGQAGNLELRRLLSAYVAVCKAVDYAHDHGIVHRDLKGSNVILGEHGEVFLLDWGMAKFISDRPATEAADRVDLATIAPASETRPGDKLGTPAYMAPEQAAGATDKIDRRTDVYALGVILYEILTSRLPFVVEPTPSLFADLPGDPDARKNELGRRQVNKLLYQIIHDPVPPPRCIESLTAIPLEKVCLKALAKEKAERYASAGEFAKEIESWLADEPVRAWPEPWTVRGGRWMRRHRPWVAGAVSLLAAALPLLTVMIVLSESAREKLEVEQGKTKGALKVAKTNEKLADERRILAEKMALQARFDHLYFRSREEPAAAMVGSAQLLPAAIDLNDQLLADSILLHLGAWSQEVHRLRGVCSHRGNVYAVAFSPDGRTVLTGSADTTARLWEAATGTPIGAPLQHRGDVHAVAFSPDGKTVLTGSTDWTARLWEAATGKPIGAPLQHQHWVYAVAFSPDGRTVLTGSRDKTARLWEAATGTPIGATLQHKGQVSAVAFSPDGKTMLTKEDNTARLWEAATGTPIRPPLQHQDWVSAVAFSPDGRTVLTGSADKTARLWEAATGKPIGAPLQHKDGVRAVAFSPDGRTVLTGSRDNTARLWEAATGKPIGAPLQHKDGVNAVAFSPDGKTVLTGSEDNTARLWEAATGTPIGAPLQHKDGVSAVAFSPDGKTMLTKDNTARLWEAATGTPIGPPLQHKSGVNAVAFSPDGKTVLTGTGLKYRIPTFSRDGELRRGSEDNTARLWEAATGKPIGAPRYHPDEIHAVTFSPDGRTFLTVTHGLMKDTARLWEVDAGTLIGPPPWPPPTAQWHQDGVLAAAFGPGGKTVLAGVAGNTLRLWEAATGKPIGAPLQHQHWVSAVAFSPDGRTVLTGSADTTARLWEAATGKPIGAPLQHQDWVNAVAFSPDGRTVLTGSEDKTARLWRFRQVRGDPKQVLAWTQVLTGLEMDEEGIVRVLDAENWHERRKRLQKLVGSPER